MLCQLSYLASEPNDGDTTGANPSRSIAFDPGDLGLGHASALIEKGTEPVTRAAFALVTRPLPARSPERVARRLLLSCDHVTANEAQIDPAATASAPLGARR